MPFFSSVRISYRLVCWLKNQFFIDNVFYRFLSFLEAFLRAFFEYFEQLFEDIDFMKKQHLVEARALFSRFGKV